MRMLFQLTTKSIINLSIRFFGYFFQEFKEKSTTNIKIFLSINYYYKVETILQTPNLVRRLIELLYDDEAMHPALLALGNLVTGEEDDTQRVLNAGLLSHLV